MELIKLCTWRRMPFHINGALCAILILISQIKINVPSMIFLFLKKIISHFARHKTALRLSAARRALFKPQGLGACAQKLTVT